MNQESFFKRQIIPLSLTFIVCAFLVALLHGEIKLINYFTPLDIVLHFRLADILIGVTVYLKTSIDFAIFIGRLIDKNRGWKSRVAIEVGTALGNAVGTFAILAVWSFFHQISWLLCLMIFIAALVLLKMAEESLEHISRSNNGGLQRAASNIASVLAKVNKIFNPVLKYIVPKTSAQARESLPFWGLVAFSFIIPFILGMDDFAGYVPLFNIVNVFGFATGVFIGHMVLNILLYISPRHTIAVIKNSYISFAGSLAFIGLAVWGIFEVVKIVFHTH